MRRTPALIVGGGPAGSAAAIVLARGGVRAELIERTRAEHDVVCGGFLGWDALAALRRLGIEPESLGARPIHRLRLVSGSRTVEADLPQQAAGLSRRSLDAALLQAAQAAGTGVSRGRSVRSVDPATLAVRIDDGEEIAPQAVFLATGKYELRGLARTVPSGSDEPAAGLRCAIPAARLEQALAGTIELHLFDGGYAGLLLQEDGRANLCLSVARRRLSDAGGIAPLLKELSREAPRLADRISGDLPDDWEAVAGVPYGWRATRTRPGLFRIGDQGAVIASLAGDGIAIALASGQAAACAYLAGGPAGAPAWQRRFAGRSARPLKIAETLRHAAERDGQRRALMRLLATAPGLTRVAARLTRIG